VIVGRCGGAAATGPPTAFMMKEAMIVYSMNMRIEWDLSSFAMRFNDYGFQTRVSHLQFAEREKFEEQSGQKNNKYMMKTSHKQTPNIMI
jgi:hypothetical protein